MIIILLSRMHEMCGCYCMLLCMWLIRQMW